MKKMPDSITDGPRHPDEDAEMMTEQELKEERIEKLQAEWVEAWERDDFKRCEELNEALRDIAQTRYDAKGFWK
jgi:hypothetical protein